MRLRRRPTPAVVRATLLRLRAAQPGRIIHRTDLVAALREETGVSRATGYRAVAAALAAGEIVPRAAPETTGGGAT